MLIEKWVEKHLSFSSSYRDLLFLSTSLNGTLSIRVRPVSGICKRSKIKPK